MIKTIIIFYATMVTFIYASSYFHNYKPEESTTPIECDPGFKGSIKCFKSGYGMHTLHCTVNCTSDDWKYFYLTNTHWYNSKPIKIYISTVIPTESSNITKLVKCDDGYNTTRVCFSSNIEQNRMSLICRINCTSYTDFYMYEYNMLLNKERKPYYESIHTIDSNPDKWPLEKRNLRENCYN